MAVKVASLLLAKVTQGSADAYAEFEIVTGLAANSRIAYQIRGITMQHTQLIGADCTVQVALTRRTKASMPVITDADLIAYWMYQAEMTTSGMYWAPTVHRWEPFGQVLVVEDPLYFQIDTSGTSATNSAWLRVEYDVITISENERLSLLARSLLTVQA